MKKIKILVYSIVTIVIIAVGVVLFAPSFIDFNTQRDKINQLLSSQLGRPVQIDGDIQLQFVPRPYAKIENVRVLPFDGETDVLTVASIEAEFMLQKLFFGQLVFNAIRVEEPQIKLYVSDEGVESWTPKRTRRGQAFAPANLRPIHSLGKVTVNNLSLQYINRQEGRARELRNIELSLDGVNLGAVRYELRGMIDHLPLALTGDVDLNALDEIRGRNVLGLGPLEITAEGRLADVFDQPLFDGQLNIVGNQPLATLNRLNIVLPFVNDMPIDQIDHRARTLMSAKMVRLENMITNVNDTQATGSIEVRIGAESIDTNATLRLDRLDLNRYLPENTEPATERWSSRMIDLRPMQNRNLKLDVQIGELVYRNHTLRDVALKGENVRGIATLENLGFNLAGGIYRSNGRMDIGTSSRMRYSGKLEGIPFDALLDKPHGYIDGMLAADFDFNFGGSSVQDFMSSLTGQVNLSIPNGVLKGLRIEDLSLALNSMFDGKTQGADSPFTGMAARVFVENGVIRNDNFRLVSGDIEILGNGKIDMLNGTINYRMRPVVSDRLGSVVLPVTLRGSIERPQVIPDLLTAPTPMAADEAPVFGDEQTAPNQPAARPQQPQQGRVDLPFNFGDDQNLRDNVLKFLEKNE